MCGIVDYIGQKDAYPILIKELKRLEYRGYDSAGISCIFTYVHNFINLGRGFDQPRNLAKSVTVE